MTIRKRNISLEKDNIGSMPCQSLRVNSWIALLLRNKFLIALIIRLSSVFLTKTFFVPDEFWQSTEIAHRKVFGYGYVTWEWKEKIRSYLHPFVFELYFHMLKFCQLDTTNAVVFGPHILQAFLTALCDVSVYYLCLKIYNNTNIATISFTLQLSSWFVYYTGSRTLSNTAEMCFACIGLSFFPFFQSSGYDSDRKQRENSLFLALLFGGIACIIRPTSLIIFGVLLLSALKRGGFIFNLIASGVKVFPCLLLLSFGVDFYYYQEFCLVHWNFFKFNVFQNLSGFYGVHPFHWYLTQGLPVVLFVQIVFVVCGFCCGKKNGVISLITVLYVLIHSLIEHKEFRFLLPIVPLFMCIAGHGLQELSKLFKWKQTILLLITLLMNIFPVTYFSVIHQRGVLDVVKYLRHEIETRKDIDVLYLMPCHSTPYYSYIHCNISMRFLTCHPNQTNGYIEEAEKFYANPSEWLEMEVVNNELYNPTHVVAFDVLAQTAKDILPLSGYSKEITFFHSHFPEGRVGQYIDVYQKRDVT